MQDNPNAQPVADLMNPLLNQPLQLPVTDKMFYQSYRACKFTTSLQCIYSMSLVVITPHLIFTTAFNKLQLYLIYLLLIEIFLLYYHNTIRQVLNSTRIYYLLADKTEHLMHVKIQDLSPEIITAEPRVVTYYDFRDPLDTDHERKMKALSIQISNIIVTSSRAIYLMHRIQFLLYQIAHTFALFFLLFYDFTNDSSVKNLLIIVVLVGTYQYLEFYLLIIFLAIVLPYYFIKHTYNYLVIKYRAYRLEQSLQSERFSEKIAGDKDCKICLMPYEPNDSIIVLKCNQMHHFHSSCLREWAKNAITCPLCRANLSEL